MPLVSFRGPLFQRHAWQLGGHFGGLLRFPAVAVVALPAGKHSSTQ